jgi:hypothetical protein
MVPSFPFRKIEPNSASAAEDMTVRIMLLGVWIAPLCGGLGRLVRDLEDRANIYKVHIARSASTECIE